MGVFYYYYYLFYKYVLQDDEPHLLTTLVLSFSEALLINGIMQILAAHIYCVFLNSWSLVFVAILLNVFNYFYFHRNGKAIIIVKKKPMLFSNHRVSIILTILFCLTTASFLFWPPVYAKHIIENCKCLE